jgi:cysteine-rich repeat protein
MPKNRLALISLLTLFAACTESESTPKDDSGTPDGAVDACVGQGDGTPCGVGMICLSEECFTSVCGDGYIDATKDEECDDGNDVAGDGCEMDCTYSCHELADCSDDDACTGFENCIVVPTGKRCQAGLAPNCEVAMPDPCKDYLCDSSAMTLESACVVESNVVCYRDEDGDGFPNPDPGLTVPTTGVCDCEAGYMRARMDNRWDCNDHIYNVKPTVSPAPEPAFSSLPYCRDGSLAEIGDTYECEYSWKAECYKYRCEDESEPSFDFNCNKKEEPALTEAFGGSCSDTKCLGGGTWIGDKGWVAPCGATGFILSCTPDGVKECIEDYIETVQTCR